MDWWTVSIISVGLIHSKNFRSVYHKYLDNMKQQDSADTSVDELSRRNVAPGRVRHVHVTEEKHNRHNHRHHHHDQHRHHDQHKQKTSKICVEWGELWTRKYKWNEDVIIAVVSQFMQLQN